MDELKALLRDLHARVDTVAVGLAELNEHFDTYKETQEERDAERDKVARLWRGLILLTIVVGVICAGAGGAWIYQQWHTNHRVNATCHKLERANDAARQLYDVQIEQSQPQVRQLRQLDPDTKLAPGITVHEQLKLYDEQVHDIRLYEAALSKINC